MSEAQGERHLASPETGLIHGSLPLDEALGIFEFSDTADEESQGLLSLALYGLHQIFKSGKVHNGLISDYQDVRKLDFGKSEGAPFWEDYGVRIEALKEELYAAYIDQVAGEMASYTEVLIDNPKLIRIGSPDGEYLTGVDLECEDPSTKSSYNYHDQVIAYTGEGEATPVRYQTKLFVDLAGLSPTAQRAAKEYCEVMEINPL